ncbi:hypothetical protein GTA51_14625 [Desulfovibrio aerotolerans]|uniref:DUF106 domain-containing protein n=1 Tax=Solidesulfovibrio aerotolerans TaxID=295255 RepID=A0A7C9IV36_9BACT|nr:hypothetical protein [Solidesulfovibrio aerotolerans]MYL84360.1 hypothetical protein [Solidesulfovibrio aerotolerans]
MNDFFLSAFLVIDAILVAPFRWFANAQAGFFCGLAVLAVTSAVLGRACAAGVARVHRAKRERQDAEIKRHQDLSFSALAAKDRAVYLAANHLAQEAYGNSMALAAGRAAALIWPALLVLAWAGWRFAGVPLPLVGESAGPAVFFLPLYIAALWGVSRLGRAWRARRAATASSDAIHFPPGPK